MPFSALLNTLLFVGTVSGFMFLDKVSHLKLPATVSPSESYKMFGNTAEEAAYDPTHQMLYVVGETSRLLHVVDISDPANPKRAYTHTFTASDGIPRDVAVCGNEVAVAITSPIKDVYEGHVYFYRTFAAGDSDLTFDGKVTVGSYPDMLLFDDQCTQLWVANEGRAGKDIANKFMDPRGSIALIQRRGGNPSETFITFDGFENRYDLRMPSRYAKSQNVWPLTTDPLFAEDAVPEYIALDSRYAYVVFQKNNAIGKINLKTRNVTSITPLPMKEWKDLKIDPSDRDGGIHMREFPFVSLRQPDTTKILTAGSKTFLVTADEGTTTSYTSSLHGFNWKDNSYVNTLARGNRYDPLRINNDTFIDDLKLDNKAGRMTVSTIDGLDLFSNKYDSAVHFGGRGFSIWDTADLSLVYDSGDEIETHIMTNTPNAFNTDCVSSTITYQSPENLRDTQSGRYGPKIGVLDVVTDNGSTFIVLGSETVGMIFLYSVNTTTGVPVPTFEAAIRAGRTDFVWQELYDLDEAGDAGISKVGFIPSNQNSLNATLIYVIGQYSGTVSLYRIQNL